MELLIFADPRSAAHEAAQRLAAAASAAVARRQRFLMALSGGRSPWEMLRLLAAMPLPWEKVYIFQVDERQAPLGHPDRNLTHIRRNLLSLAPLPPENLFPMPVDLADLHLAASQYAQTMEDLAGLPPVLDLIQLGLGADGHTASLLPSDPVLDVVDRDVAPTGSYEGRRRLTLTYPLLNRARCLLWLVTGAAKAKALAQLVAGDTSQPAGRLRREESVILADQAAAARLP